MAVHAFVDASTTGWSGNYSKQINALIAKAQAYTPPTAGGQLEVTNMQPDGGKAEKVNGKVAS